MCHHSGKISPKTVTGPKICLVRSMEEGTGKAGFRMLFGGGRRTAENEQKAFSLFPHIELMTRALPLFQKLHSDIAAVHSEDPERKEKVQRMRDGSIPILLTTTILERGVTFPNIDVAVVGAEDDTFTESALVQIAGRVGRNPKFPTGDITFFHFGKTRAMIRAKNQLIRMNKEALKKGLVDM